jgi:hypothetical protein
MGGTVPVLGKGDGGTYGCLARCFVKRTKVTRLPTGHAAGGLIRHRSLPVLDAAL